MQEKICTCFCHKEGSDFRHVMPCCSLCYEQYIDENDQIDYDKYTELKIKKGNIDKVFSKLSVPKDSKKFKDGVLAIVGSRTFTDEKLFVHLADLVFFKIPFLKRRIVSGGAPGVDTLAEEWAKKSLIECKVFKADWKNLEVQPCKIKYNSKGEPYNALAGFNRNKEIIREADVVFAIWDGSSSGTLDSLKIAKKMKKDIIIYNFKTNKWQNDF